MKILISIFLVFAVFNPAAAEIKTQTVDYNDGDTQLRGYIAWDDAIKGKRPGILVAHEWWGLNDYAKSRTRQLAELGYVAFALDMYGADKFTRHGEQAKEWLNQIAQNIDIWQSRANIGLTQLTTHPLVDGDKLAAIGYCFGGATIMQLAYSGASLDGIVSFHGSLPPVQEPQYNNIKAKILVAHGNADPFVPSEKVQAFQASMEAAGADWQMLSFGGVKHGFTNPEADSYGIDPLRYDANADHRSWQAMQSFFIEIFAD